LIGDESEKHFRERVVRYAKLRGWRVFYTFDSVGTAPGEFDLRMYRPPRVIHAELKSEHGRLTPDQRDMLPIYEACPGIETYVWKPSDERTIWQVLG
jgi:hypothetical protein